MTLIRKDKAKKCSWCGRYYKGDSQCNVCLSADKVANADPNSEDPRVVAELEQARGLYKQYASILPLLLRMVTCFKYKKKYCFEDDGIIIFVIGKRRYRFDKLNAKRMGMIKAASRMRKK